MLVQDSMRIYGYQDNAEDIRDLTRRLYISIIINFILSLCICGVFAYILFIRCNSIESNVEFLHDAVAQIAETPAVDVNAIHKDINDVNSSVHSLSDNVQSALDSIDERLNVCEQNDTILSDDLNLIYDMITESNNRQLSFTYDDAIDDSGDIYKYSIIETDGHISKAYFDSVVSYYELIPVNIRNALVSDGWKIIITSGNIEINNISAKIAAVTVCDDKLIYVSTLDDTSIIHEVGHYIDFKNNFCSNDFNAYEYASDLDGFMLIDGQTHKNNYSTTVEFFAECFSLYILKNNDLANNCPYIYNYIEKSLKIFQ